MPLYRTAPGLDDFEMTGSLDPSKRAVKAAKKGKGLLTAPEEINLTPSLAGQSQIGALQTESGVLASPALISKKAGFQRIARRPIDSSDNEGTGKRPRHE